MRNGPALALTISLFAGSAFAHQVGVSSADFTIQPDGRVDVAIVLAASETLRSFRLDRNGNGVVSDDEVRARQQDLALFFTEGIDVFADDGRCSGHFDGADITETDGLRITGHFACDAGPKTVRTTLYYLSDLGANHRQVVRLAAGDATTEKLLSATNRALSLDLPVAMRKPHKNPTRLVILTLAFSIFFAVLFAWRLRVFRRAGQPKP